MKLPFLLISLGISASPVWAELSNLQRLKKEGFKISAKIVDLNSGQTMEEIDPHAALTPASVTKLIIGALSLEYFPFNHQFESSFYSTSPIQNGHITGNLIFYGGGDPSLINEKLIPFIFTLKRMGVHTIEGNLVLNRSYFGNVDGLDSNRLSGAKMSSHAYDSPLSSVALNYSVMPIVVVPTKAQKPALIFTEPELPIQIINHVKTTAGGYKKNDLNVSRSSHAGVDSIHAAGNIMEGSEPRFFYRSVSNAEEYAGKVLKSILASAGITVKGQIKVENEPLTGNEHLLLTLKGDHVEEILKPIMRPSNNFVADMMTLQVIKKDLPPLSKGINLSSSSKRLVDFIKDSALKTRFKGHSEEPQIYNGSGLDPRNKVSATQMIAILDRVFLNAESFAPYLAALPKPGTDGTLRRRFDGTVQQKKLVQQIFAKTGTLTEPVPAIGLSGYLRLRKGGFAAFCILVNGTHSFKGMSVERLKDAIDRDVINFLEKE